MNAESVDTIRSGFFVGVAGIVAAIAERELPFDVCPRWVNDSKMVDMTTFSIGMLYWNDEKWINFSWEMIKMYVTMLVSYLPIGGISTKLAEQ